MVDTQTMRQVLLNEIITDHEAGRVGVDVAQQEIVAVECAGLAELQDRFAALTRQ